MSARLLLAAALAVASAGCFVLVGFGEFDTSLPAADGAADAPSGDFTLTLAPRRLTVLPGTLAKLGVTLTPRGGFAGRVSLTVIGLPAGVTASSVDFDVSGITTAELVILADATVGQQRSPAMVVATSEARTAQSSLDLFVRGPPGSLDLTFAQGGMAISLRAPKMEQFGILVRPDDRIVAYGGNSVGASTTAVLIGYDVDGRPDPTFGGGVPVETPSPVASPLVAAALDGDGTLVGVAADKAQLALFRYRFDGSLAPTFGPGGIVVLDAGLELGGIAIASSGRILLAGAPIGGGTTQLWAFDHGGSVDPTYGDAGFGETLVGNTAAIAIAPTGDVTLGVTRPEGSCAIIAVDGQGRVVSGTLGSPSNCRSSGVVVDDAGARAVVGTYIPNATQNLELDVVTAESGKLGLPLGPYAGLTGAGVAFDAQGRLVVVASRGENASPADISGIVLTRFGRDLTPDPTFHAVDLVPPGGSVTATAVALQSDGRIIVAGNATFDSSAVRAMLVARFWP